MMPDGIVSWRRGRPRNPGARRAFCAFRSVRVLKGGVKGSCELFYLPEASISWPPCRWRPRRPPIRPGYSRYRPLFRRRPTCRSCASGPPSWGCCVWGSDPAALVARVLCAGSDDETRWSSRYPAAAPRIARTGRPPERCGNSAPRRHRAVIKPYAVTHSNRPASGSPPVGVRAASLWLEVSAEPGQVQQRRPPFGRHQHDQVV